MADFVFRCPATGFNVQGYVPGETSDDENAYEAVECLMCKRVHLVNPATGKVVGGNDKRDRL